MQTIRLVALGALCLGASPGGCQICSSGSKFEQSLSTLLAEASRKVQDKGITSEPFMWGTATAAYQVEGAYNEDGRAESIWDVFSHRSRDEQEGRVAKGHTGDQAVDFYHRYAEDIAMLKSLNFTHFRFSISWPRVMPMGTKNDAGVAFYKDVVKVLRDNNIEPVVTLFHWDLPANLDWREDEVVEEYVKFADLMFHELRDVKYWITFNEPWVFCKLGYKWGMHAPGLRTDTDHLKCGRNVLRSHARAYRLFKQTYGVLRKDAQVGITLNAEWRVPFDPQKDAEAARSEMESQLAWFADPIFLSGDYPESMKAEFGDALPPLTEAEREMLKGSSDFFGLNHYTTVYVQSGTAANKHDRNGVPIGPRAASPWLYIVPWGFRKVLNYIQDRYNPNKIIVTENGMSDEDTSNVDDLINDQMRVSYYFQYLEAMGRAIVEDNVNVIGYFAWSLVDNFEWADGYEKRFGLVYVNYASMERTPKASAWFFGSLIPAVQRETESCVSPSE